MIKNHENYKSTGEKRMQIYTPDFLCARFFMKNDIQENIDMLPRIAPAQIHSDNIIYIDNENFSSYALPEKPKADGILLATEKAGASLRFADCAPVLIYSDFWALLLHSGYKGTVLNISHKGLELVTQKFGDNALKNSSAWIGPCIGRENYERKISDEWSIRGMKVFHSENCDIKSEHVYFDLAGEIKSQLIESGINEKNITLSGINTFTSPECYSYRKGNVNSNERMMLYVKLRQTC